MYKIKILFFLEFIIPMMGVVLVLIIPSKEDKFLKLSALGSSCLTFLCCLFLLTSYFQNPTSSFQFVLSYEWWMPISGQTIISWGIDGTSIFFLLLTTFLVPLCMVSGWNSTSLSLKEFLIAFLFLELFLVNAFCTLDLLIFYASFESILIPMFFIIGIWGSRERKILAAYYFFLYTLLGSVVMLLAIIYILDLTGTTDYETILGVTSFTVHEQRFLWFAFFLAFACKVPVIPAHLWLPEAHVEAPTTGSVILAGILLKLGIYGLLRISLPLFSETSFFFAPIIYAISIISILYASFSAIRQSDLKKIIAYTSVAHMNLVTLGIFSFNSVGMEGALTQSISHGIVSSALFLTVSILYDRYRTRLIFYYGGLASSMPLFSIILSFFTMANMSLPGTSSFVGELLILAGSFKINTTATFLGALGIIVGASYSLWLLNRVIFGNLKHQFVAIFLDTNQKEIVLFLPLIIATLLIGICPNTVLSFIHININNLIELFCVDEKFFMHQDKLTENLLLREAMKSERKLNLITRIHLYHHKTGKFANSCDSLECSMLFDISGAIETIFGVLKTGKSYSDFIESLNSASELTNKYLRYAGKIGISFLELLYFSSKAKELGLPLDPFFKMLKEIRNRLAKEGYKRSPADEDVDFTETESTLFNILMGGFLHRFFSQAIKVSMDLEEYLYWVQVARDLNLPASLVFEVVLKVREILAGDGVSPSETTCAPGSPCATTSEKTCAPGSPCATTSETTCAPGSPCATTSETTCAPGSPCATTSEKTCAPCGAVLGIQIGLTKKETDLFWSIMGDILVHFVDVSEKLDMDLEDYAGLREAAREEGYPVDKFFEILIVVLETYPENSKECLNLFNILMGYELSQITKQRLKAEAEAEAKAGVCKSCK